MSASFGVIICAMWAAVGWLYGYDHGLRRQKND
jgi:hypothetical protein